MAKIHENQIKAGSGLHLSGPYPVDDRLVVESFSDLATLVSSNCAYEGMQVYVDDDKKTYEYNNKNWITYATSQSVEELKEDLEERVSTLEGVEVTYSNDTPIVSEIGSIKPGQTFSNVTIQDMLTMILYPYIDIEVGNPAADQSAGNYTIPNYPVLQTVTIYVKKNSATNLSFSLWDTTSNKQVGKTLYETDISDNKLTFTDLNLTINTNRTFQIKYTYKGENGSDISEQTKDVGTFTLTFIKPSNPTISSNLSSTSYFNGQTADVSSITTNVANLNSASDGITKLELYKGESRSAEQISPTLPHIFNLNDSITTDTTYKVKAYYKERNATNDTYYDAFVENTYSITFSHKNADISLSGVSGGTYSKFNTTTISDKAVKANFIKYSDKITSVKLFEGNTLKDTQSITGHNGNDYSDTLGSATFNYSKSNICSNMMLKAVAYNGSSIVAESSEVSFSFYAPYCYGFVDADVTYNDIVYSTLESLTNQSRYDPSTVQLSKPNKQMKVVYAVPNGNYSNIKDLSTGLTATDSFTSGKKDIKFADDSTVSYQIFILTNAVQAEIKLQFS